MSRYKLPSCVFQDQSGNVVASGTCSVLLAGTSTAASIYAASSGGAAVNSVTSDSAGQCTFYVDTGDYEYSQLFDITLSKTDFTSKTFPNVVIFPALGSVLRLLSDTASGITALTDLSVEAIQTLFTVPTGKTCILSHAIVEVSGDAGASGVFTIGQGAGATDFVGTTNVDNLDADGDCILMMPVPSATPATLKAYAAGSVISLDVATGANAVTGSCYLFGFLY